MGINSSKNTQSHPQPQYYEDNDFSEAALAKRAEDIRKEFPIVITANDAILPGYTAFISPDSPPYLTRLPPELIEILASHLDNRSIKSLRLTCKLFSSVRLRITRVFLSANLLNVEVFRSIADHDSYRQDVTEIIYDDARLCRSFIDHADDLNPDTDDWRLEAPTDMEWFQTERDEQLDELANRQSNDEPSRPEHVRRARQVHAELSLQESWLYYQDLLRQQHEVIDSGTDVEALRYGLRRFPSLQKVTVTPAAHGWLFTPLYETPMIRAFPYGFNYPIPRGWPTRRAGRATAFLEPWEDTKARWRGFSIVAEVLAQEQQYHHVSEFSIDAHYLHTGLSCRLFEQPCQEYLNLLSILQQPNFRRLHLSLNVNGQQLRDWAAFRNYLLRNALAEASQLEHFSLETSWDEEPFSGDAAQAPTLRTFLPIDSWTGLHHFRLWNFPVQREDLISTLSQLSGLRSLELGFLDIYSGTHFELLNDMRDSLRWHERLTPPRVKYAVPVSSNSIQGRAIWLDEDVEKFLYHDGENPFDPTYNEVHYGMGIVKDAYDAAHERPYLDPWKYVELGYSERPSGVIQSNQS